MLSKSPVLSQSLKDWHASLNHGPFSPQGNDSQVACLALAVAFLVHQSRCAHQTSTADLDFVWTLILNALQSEVIQSGIVSASRSAQGFLAIPLCSIVSGGNIDILFRLHVWLPDGQRGEHGFGIHSHQPFAQSWVLTGEGKDRPYTVEPVSDGSLATHSKYALAWSSGSGLNTEYGIHQTHSRVVNTGSHVRAEPGRVTIHHRDTSYTISAGQFHSSEIEPDRMHATLFLFDGSQGFVQDAPVLGPKEALSHTQVRDTAGVSITALVGLVDVMRKGENHLTGAKEHVRGLRTQQAFTELMKAYQLSETVPKSLYKEKFQESVFNELQLLLDTHATDHPIKIAEWRYFFGRALLLAGQEARGLKQFNCSSIMTPVIAFCKEPSAQRKGYLRHLARYGADFERIDEHGCSALDYAVMNSDAVAEEIVLDALRSCISTLARAECELHDRVREAKVRKHFRNIIRTIIRPALISRRNRMLVDVRDAYSKALLNDPANASAFDPLKYIQLSDLIRFKDFPRSSNGLTQVYRPKEDADMFLIFVSYRWLNPNPWATTPDDCERSQYRRTLQAIEQFLHKHPSIKREKLGLWIDFACINQDSPLAGIAALPLSLAQCNATISMVDDRYYSRAWCSLETKLSQALQRTYGTQLWYEYVETQFTLGRPDSMSRKDYTDSRVNLSQRSLRFEQDRPRIMFLEQQTKLLTALP